MKDETLYVAMDDSNHCGDRKGDIIVAPFSFDSQDVIIKQFKNRRDREVLKKWVGSSIQYGLPKDYCFAILLDDTLRRLQPNIALVAPPLIDSIILNHPRVENVELYIDGIVKSKFKDYIRDYFKPKFPKFKVQNFIKRNHIHYCPKLIYIAHILAHDIYDGSFEEIVENQKRVLIDEKKLLETLEGIVR